MNTSCTHPTRYATDLTNAEWDIIAPYVNPDSSIGSPRSVCMRCVVNALFYIDKTGCQWQLLPSDLPNYGTVYYHFRRWSEDGMLERLNTDLRRMLRTRYQRDPDPSVAIVDSQSVKTTEVGGDAGYDAGKQVYGRKHHILVDSSAYYCWPSSRQRPCKMRAVPPSWRHACVATCHASKR